MFWGSTFNTQLVETGLSYTVPCVHKRLGLCYQQLCVYASQRMHVWFIRNCLYFLQRCLSDLNASQTALRPRSETLRPTPSKLASTHPTHQTDTGLKTLTSWCKLSVIETQREMFYSAFVLCEAMLTFISSSLHWTTSGNKSTTSDSFESWTCRTWNWY